MVFNIKDYETIINTNNQKELENLFLSLFKDLFDAPSTDTTANKKYGINLSKFIFKNFVESVQAKGNRYIEYRYVGGENIDEDLIIDKLKYFCYITYLMTSDHNEREYLRKLFSFKERIRERFERDIKEFRENEKKKKKKS